jgi:hypothetical protein
MDKILGELLDRLGPDSTIIVCSDHAFIFEGGGYNHYESREIPHGILLIKGPKSKSGTKSRKRASTISCP